MEESKKRRSDLNRHRPPLLLANLPFLFFKYFQQLHLVINSFDYYFNLLQRVFNFMHFTGCECLYLKERLTKEGN